MRKTVLLGLSIASLLAAGCASHPPAGSQPQQPVVVPIASAPSPWQAVSDQLAKLVQGSDTQVTQTANGLRVTLPANDGFATGSARITPSLRNGLGPVVQVLSTHPELQAAITGYTDNTGNAQANVALSKRRAYAVRHFLITRGIAGNRLSADGAGAANPIADNGTAQGRAANRRIEIDLSMAGGSANQ